MSNILPAAGIRRPGMRTQGLRRALMYRKGQQKKKKNRDHCPAHRLSALNLLSSCQRQRQHGNVVFLPEALRRVRDLRRLQPRQLQ